MPKNRIPHHTSPMGDFLVMLGAYYADLFADDLWLLAEPGDWYTFTPNGVR